MTSQQLRSEFLNFFKDKGHKIVASSSLLPTDPSVLFTTAGMQQFKEYFLGKKSPYGNKVVSCQKCFRTSDIEEVGDNRHLTFLEMLGNFSFGGYGKEEAIKLAKDFLDSIDIKIDYVTVFEGDKDVPCDEEAISIWKKLGIPADKIKKHGRADNFWGPTGEEGPCGPTTEIYVNGIEVWNLVFNEYYQDTKKKLSSLKQKGVDTGMGLERLAMVSQGKSSVFETDLFLPITNLFPEFVSEKTKCIIADHAKASVFLIADGVIPSNKDRGYVLRRLLRRMVIKMRSFSNMVFPPVSIITEIYQNLYKFNKEEILQIIKNELDKFTGTLAQGIKEIEKADNLTGERAFSIYETYGVPLEVIEEIKSVKNREDFFSELKKHQELSRTASTGMFKGGLANTSEIAIKYHTATHLLLAALREVLGPEIYQKGSNITAERLRFDFNYPQKMTDVQIKEVEEMVNRKIKEDILVEMKEMPKNEALKIAKVSFDPEKYGEAVKVYKIGDFSIELCGGPHVQRTSELGVFKITKEESSSAGIRRIRAVLK